MIHLHSILWLALVVFLVTVLYQRLIGPSWVAGLAALLYLLDDSNYWPTMWIANRNLLISLVFGILTLISHHKWRKDNSLRAAIIAPFCLALSLLATEAGIATFAYLLAYAIVFDEASRVRRLLSIVLYLLLIVLWRIIYNGLGHGANEIAVFADPGREPFRYMQLALQRLPVLLMGQWGFLSAEIFLLVSDLAKTVLWLGSLVFVSVVFLTFLPFLRTDRIARFWFAGMLLSVPPICATLPMNRNLLFVAIGSFALIAQFVGYVRNSNSLTSKSRLWRFMAFVVCAMLLFIHVLMSLTTRAAAPKAVAFLHDYVRRTVSIGAESELKNQDVIIVNAPNPFMCFFISSIKAHNGEPLPRSIRILAPGFNALEVVRTETRELLLRAKKGNIFTCQQQSILHLVYMFNQASGALRDDSFRVPSGMRVELPRFTAEVVSVDKKDLPTEISFTFDVSLEDPSLKWLWLDWTEYCYRPFEPPEVDKCCRIRGPFE